MTFPGDVTVVDAGGDAASAAADAANTKGLAATLASKMAAAATATAKPDAAAVVDPNAAVPATDAGTTVEDATATTGAAPVTEEPKTEDTPSLTEIEEALQAVGVDLGISAKDVPPELLPAYQKLVQTASDMAQELVEQSLVATQQQQAVEDFRKKLEENPDRILLTIAATRPDIFQKAVETFTEMQNDPRAKDIVVRELQSEARLREAERREAALNQRDQRARAMRVVAETKRAARKYGVNYEIAEKVIAMAVEANQGQFDVTDVDSVVADLRPAKPTAAPRLATPQKVAAAAAAPSKSVATATPAPTSPGLEAGKARQGGGGVFGKLIRAANQRLSTPG